jgi:hemolysin D
MTTHVAPATVPSAANEPRPAHPAWQLLRRYRATLAAAWALRHELAGPKRLADEAAFLPAALSLQETPVHPAPRRLAIAICALFTIAVLWSVLGQLDIVAVAQGRVIVSERTKTIQPLEAGVVTRIAVRDGDTVTAGQVLVELDATAARADHGSVAEQLRAAEAELARSTALLTALASGRAPMVDAALASGRAPMVDAALASGRAPVAGAPSANDSARGASASSAANPDRSAPTAADAATLMAEWADLTAKLAQLDAEQQRRAAEAATVREAVAKLETMLPMARQREADMQALAEQGFVNRHAGQDRTRERIELERDLALQQARLAESRAAQAEGEARRAAFIAETRRTLRDRQAQARLQRDQLAQQHDKTEHRERLTRLTSPVDGTVQQLAVHTPGGVVTPAQVLMVVVPRTRGEAGVETADGSPSGVSAEVVLENKDIGFIRVGQRARIKLETFPFTRFGTLDATVIRVSADAVPDERRGAVFLATLQLDQPTIEVGGRPIALAPGMNLTAEIKTGQRRVIDYLLGPIEAATAQSLKER